jgi:hypothetical protein
MPDSFNDPIMRMAALRHALSGLCPLQAKALLVAVREASRDPALQHDLMRGLADMGQFMQGQMEGLDDESARILAAFRYCLGRMTSVTIACAERIVDTWDDIHPTARDAIVSEIEAAIGSGRAGMSCDVAGWQMVLNRAGKAPVPA